MSGFAKYTHRDSLRLKERPYYRRRGVDALHTFVNNSMANYESNANRIRDARFAKSNELNRDFAIRNKREQMLSEAYMTERDPVKLAGLHGRLRMKLSRSDGALSTEMPYVYKTKFKAPKKVSTSSGGSAQAPMSAVRFAPENDPQSVAPTPEKRKDKHSSPSRNIVEQRKKRTNEYLRRTHGIPTDAEVDEYDQQITRQTVRSPSKTTSTESTLSPIQQRLRQRVRKEKRVSKSIT